MGNVENKKKRRKNNASADTSRRILAQARVKLLKSPRPSSTLSAIRATLRPGDYAALLSWLSGQSRLCARTIADPFPKTIQDLNPFTPPRPLDLLREIQWSYSRLEPLFSMISGFNQLRDKVDDAFMQGDGALCLNLLSHIEEEYGVSIWLLKKKIALLQHFHGLEKQKSFTRSIITNNSTNSIISYITHYVSYRSEPSVSPITFKNAYDTSIRDLELDLYIKSYLRQHIVCVPPDTLDECAGMLSIEIAGTAVDAYEMFVLALQLSVAHGFLSANPHIVTIVKHCADQTSDTRWLRLLFLLGENINASYHAPIVADYLESLLLGDNDGLQLAQRDTDRQDVDCVTRVLLSLSLILANIEYDVAQYIIYSDLYRAIDSVLNGTEGCERAAEVIMRDAWALDGNSAACLLRLILEWSWTTDNDMNNQNKWLFLVAAIGKLSPFDLWWISDPGLRAMHIATFSNNYHEPNMWRAIESDESLSSIDIFHLRSNAIGLWRIMLRYVRENNMHYALDAAEELLAQDNSFLRRQAGRTIPLCMLTLGKTKECVSFIVNSSIADSSLSPVMPVRAVVDSLPYKEKLLMNDYLAFAILIDLYVSRFNSDIAHLRSYAAEDFLTAHSLKRPTDLRGRIDGYDLLQVKHFLRNICIESVMDTWAIFESSQEVSNERAAVCQLLTEIDPVNKDEYQAEIRSIMRKIALRQRLREVEQSKIYVDTNSVKNVAREALRESYSRYRDFIITGISPEIIKLYKDTRNQVAQGDVEALLSSAFPRNEMTELLESIVLRLRDEFVSSSQHGLDGYLSIRIRHGTLAGHLRGPLEAESLVSIRDSKSGSYKANVFWPEALCLKGADTEARLQAALAEFSESFDELIEEIKSSWIQIKKTRESTGLFDFMLLQPEVDYLSTGINGEMSIDVFLDYILAYFYSEKLEPSLKRIRSQLQNIAKPRVNEMLLELLTSVSNAYGVDATSAFRSAIGRARTQLQNVLDRITEWFRLSKSDMGSEPFSIEEAVNISTASIQASYPDFTSILAPSTELDDFRISGSLPSFVDLLYLAFDNAARHSQLKPHPVVDVAFHISDEMLSVRIENTLGPSVCQKDTLLAVDKIRNAMSGNPFSPSVRTEKGSGFYKMQKILHHDFSPLSGDRRASLNFGVSEGDRFYVHMTIPIHKWE